LKKWAYPRAYVASWKPGWTLTISFSFSTASETVPGSFMRGRACS